jgi:hypothetical protein
VHINTVGKLDFVEKMVRDMSLSVSFCISGHKNTRRAKFKKKFFSSRPVLSGFRYAVTNQNNVININTAVRIWNLAKSISARILVF